ncbi:MAG: acetate/propionate family kinase, partial [Myxococcales bacterium FL481]
EAIVFGGGIGENSAILRERILKQFSWCGLHVDPTANANTVSGKAGRISSEQGSMHAWVSPVDEASLIASDAAAVLGAV